MDSELRDRIDALYASLGAVTDWNIENYPVQVIQTKEGHGVYQDFNGTAKPGDLTNAIQILISNVAGVHENVVMWAKANGVNHKPIQDFLNTSADFETVRILADRHRHPFPDTRKNRSLKLGKVHAVLQLTAKAGQPAAMVIGADGATTRTGSMKRIITADVTDEAGKVLGDAHGIISKAVAHCEDTMTNFGINSSRPQDSGQ